MLDTCVIWWSVQFGKYLKMTLSLKNLNYLIYIGNEIFRPISDKYTVPHFTVFRHSSGMDVSRVLVFREVRKGQGFQSLRSDVRRH